MEKEGLKYNTERENLIISEYGRNIQVMIKQLLNIEDRKERTKAAHLVVNIMAQMNPQVKESNDYLHKLWDHLYIISEYKLDVDGPFDPPPITMASAVRISSVNLLSCSSLVPFPAETLPLKF